MNVLFWKRESAQDTTALRPRDPGAIELAPELRLDAAPTRAEQADVDAVAERLTDRKSRIRRGITFWTWMLASPILGLCSVGCLVNAEGAWSLFYAFLLLTVRVMHGLASRLQQTRSALQNSHLGPEWLGPLAEALEWPDRRVQGSAALLLTQFLPRITEEEAARLTEEQRFCLYRRLTRRAVLSDPELALAILRALPYFGTDAALANVERLVNGPAFNRTMRRVRAAARASIPLLERRVALQHDLQSAADATSAQLQMELAGMEGGNDLTFNTANTANAATIKMEGEPQELTAVAANVDAQLQDFEEELGKLQVPGMRIGFLFASWGIIVPYCSVQTYLQFAAGNWPGGLLFCVLTILSTQMYRLSLTSKHQLLARRLAKMDDVRSVGRLADALEWPDPTIQYVAMAALTRLLPRVKASDNVLHTPHQRGNLHRMLTLTNARKHDDFLIAILKALEQVGDETSLPYVEILAKAQPTSTRERKVCDAARDCLPALQNRARLNVSSQTLLRASSATATGIEMLVRPASGVNVAEHEQLLRAGSALDHR